MHWYEPNFILLCQRMCGMWLTVSNGGYSNRECSEHAMHCGAEEKYREYLNLDAVEWGLRQNYCLTNRFKSIVKDKKINKKNHNYTRENTLREFNHESSDVHIDNLSKTVILNRVICCSACIWKYWVSEVKPIKLLVPALTLYTRRIKKRWITFLFFFLMFGDRVIPLLLGL